MPASNVFFNALINCINKCNEKQAEQVKEGHGSVQTERRGGFSETMIADFYISWIVFNIFLMFGFVCKWKYQNHDLGSHLKFIIVVYLQIRYLNVDFGLLFLKN